MMLPAFRGVPAVRGIEGLTNPRGFIVVDKKQRNPTDPNVFGIGVCVAIPPVGASADPAVQSQLVGQGRLGALREDRVRMRMT